MPRRYEKCVGNFRKKHESSRPLVRHAGKKMAIFKLKLQKWTWYISFKIETSSVSW